MNIPFIDRAPTSTEMEHFRLVLSKYHNMNNKDAFTDAIATAFFGERRYFPEYFDILLGDKTTNINYGVRCHPKKDISGNYSDKFLYDSLHKKGIEPEEYTNHLDELV